MRLRKKPNLSHISNTVFVSLHVTSILTAHCRVSNVGRRAEAEADDQASSLAQVLIQAPALSQAPADRYAQGCLAAGLLLRPLNGRNWTSPAEPYKRGSLSSRANTQRCLVS